LRSIFPDKAKDFVTAVDERSVILVKEVNTGEEPEVDNYSKMIYDTLSAEAMSNVHIAVGTVVSDLKDVSNSYKEASMALEVGKIFNCEAHISTYSQLGIGRIIYQLPLPLCRMFIQEVLKGKKVENFDDETLMTVNKFFENSLNVSETSRQLYIHRNTLVYRLDKLLKMTGLDLRKFDDAIVFKITIMVSQYMEYMERQNTGKL
ncbi:MAG: helix-turn-helix domain-containing protein, partial [Niameybacter sp.]